MNAESVLSSENVFALGYCMARAHLMILALIAVGGCVTTPPDGSPRVQTPSQARRADLPNAIAAPLRDVNVLQSKIPDVLLAALEDPYARPRYIDCDWIVYEVLPLNGALGLDMREPGIDDNTLGERAGEALLGAIAGAASSNLPLRSWVRMLSGAQLHDKQISSAITAGQIRRAYLKGLGESRGARPRRDPISTDRSSPAPAGLAPRAHHFMFRSSTTKGLRLAWESRGHCPKLPMAQVTPQATAARDLVTMTTPEG